MHIELIWLQEILSDRPLCIFAKKDRSPTKIVGRLLYCTFIISMKKTHRFKLILKMKSFKYFLYSEFLVFGPNQLRWKGQPNLYILIVNSTFAKRYFTQRLTDSCGVKSMVGS